MRATRFPVSVPSQEVMGYDDFGYAEFDGGDDDELMGRGKKGHGKKSAGPSHDLFLGLQSSTAVASGSSANATTVIQDPFRLERFVVPDATSQSFILNSLFVGTSLIAAAASNVSCATFAPNAVGVRLKAAIGTPGQSIVANVTSNTGSTATATWYATCIGPALRR